MASFLLLQNHAIPVATGSATERTIITGDLSRAYNGAPLHTIQAIRKGWPVKTTWLLPTRARFLIALLQGRGHTWDFDDVSDFEYSSKGLGATSGTAANGTRNTTAKEFGAAGLQVASGSYVQWDVGYDYEWTVMVWVGNSAWSARTHYIVSSNGDKWVDGVQNNAASTPFITFSGGSLRLGDTGSGTAQYFDDLIVIDEIMDSSFAADFGAMTAAFGPLPKLRCRGAMLNQNTYHVLGTEITSEYAQGTVDGVFYNDLMSVSFVLNEHSRV